MGLEAPPIPIFLTETPAETRAVLDVYGYNFAVIRTLFSAEAFCIAIMLLALGRVAPITASQAAAMESGSHSREVSYEVVSIKPHKPFSDAGGHGYLADGLDFRGITLGGLIADAYGIADQNQIYGLPAWVLSSYYDIQAKVDAQTAETLKSLPPDALTVQQASMLRSLFADRCHLKAHLETRDLPVYDLVIAKSGLKMKEAPPEEEHGGYIVGSEMKGSSTDIQFLISNLAGWSGRKVIDKTGLTGRRFDFDLKWIPEDRRDSDPANAGPSIFTALQEQLGLKLVPSKAPVEVLVIDHIERPTPN